MAEAAESKPKRVWTAKEKAWFNKRDNAAEKYARKKIRNMDYYRTCDRTEWELQLESIFRRLSLGYELGPSELYALEAHKKEQLSLP